MKRVLITGGSGFVGSHLTRLLVNDGYEVAIAVSPRGSLWRLRDLEGRFDVLRTDLTEPNPDFRALAEWRPDTCIHLAWYAEPGKCLTADVNLPLLTGSLALLNAMIAADCKQVVMSGTCAEYDADVGYFHEESPTRPLTLYAAAKLSLGLLARQIVTSAPGLRLAWARLFLLYGPYEDERRVVPAVIRSLMNREPFLATRGEQVRDYLHVYDVASALRKLAEQNADGVFNVCSADPLTVARLMRAVGSLMDRADLVQLGALPYRKWDPPILCGSNSKLRSLGWEMRFSLEEGLRDTIQWWLNRKHETRTA